MRTFLKNSCDKVKIISIAMLCAIENTFLYIVGTLGKVFDILETTLEIILFWGALFPLKITEIKRRYILRSPVARAQIDSSGGGIELAKITIGKIQEEYTKRQDSSSEKMKTLFQTLSFVFAINAAILTYILKELKQNIDIFFVLSLIFITISLFMIIIYYNVSSVNRLTFPDRIEDYSNAEYLSYVLYCLDFNNKQLDVFVTVYKAAMRYFTVSIVFLVIGIAKQFHSLVNIPYI